MIKNNYFTDNEDIQDYFQTLIDWDEIVCEVEHDFRDYKEYSQTKQEELEFAPSNTQEALEAYKAFLDSAGEICGCDISQKSSIMDKKGLSFKDGKVNFPQEMIELYQKMEDAGLHGFATARHFGGLTFPRTMVSFFYELMSRADSSLCLTFGSLGIIETIDCFSDEEQAAKWVPKIADGSYSAAMALTEPNYGSDLPNIQTKAEKDEKGQWRINGSKRFISGGCGFENRPALILTLARTGNPSSGAKGLSFFLVQSTDLEIAGIEKKMGLSCSATCELVYNNAPAELIGKEGFGLIRYAIGMMNGARLAVSAQSTGIAQAAYSESCKYASEREQFGVPIRDIPAVKKLLDRMEREILVIRALTMEASRQVDLYSWRKFDHGNKNTDAEKNPKHDPQVRKWEKIASFFTPLAKYYGSELCNQIAFDAIQVHGGSGFTEEYDVARIYRDARITNLYEGTTQLQIVAAIGGISSGMSAKGYLRRYLEDEMASFAPSAELTEIYGLFCEICEAFKEILDTKTKNYVAFEAVESAARFIGGMLLEKTASKLSSEKREKRLRVAQAFHLDSKAKITANKIQIQGIAMKSAPSSQNTVVAAS